MEAESNCLNIDSGQLEIIPKPILKKSSVRAASF